MLGQLFPRADCAALGVPLTVLCRWIWLAGVELDERRLLHSRQTLMLGVGGALLTTACVIPIALARYPLSAPHLPDAGRVHLHHQLSAGDRAALTLVSHGHHSLCTSDLSDRNYAVLVYLLMLCPVHSLTCGPGLPERRWSSKTARSLGSTPRRHCGASPCDWPAPACGGRRWRWSSGVSNELAATLLLSPLGTRTLSTGSTLTSEIDCAAACALRHADCLDFTPPTTQAQSKNSHDV